MNKKLLSIIASVCALAVLAVGSTLAFFTATAEKENSFTMGNLSLTVTEDDSTDGTPNDDGGRTYENVKPGDELSKVPVITNTGSVDAWIRVELTVSGKDIPESDLADLKAAIIDSLSDEWSVGEDGKLYYQSPVAPDGTATLFETITVPTTWGNDTADKDFSILISAEGVQSANNGDTIADADWDVLDVTN